MRECFGQLRKNKIQSKHTNELLLSPVRNSRLNTPATIEYTNPKQSITSTQSKGVTFSVSSPQFSGSGADSFSPLKPFSFSPQTKFSVPSTPTQSIQRTQTASASVTKIESRASKFSNNSDCNLHSYVVSKCDMVTNASNSGLSSPSLSTVRSTTARVKESKRSEIDVLLLDEVIVLHCFLLLLCKEY